MRQDRWTVSSRSLGSFTTFVEASGRNRWTLHPVSEIHRKLTRHERKVTRIRVIRPFFQVEFRAKKFRVYLMMRHSMFDILCFSLRALGRTRWLSVAEQRGTKRHHSSDFGSAESERRTPFRFIRRRRSLRPHKVIRIPWFPYLASN